MFKLRIIKHTLNKFFKINIFNTQMIILY